MGVSLVLAGSSTTTDANGAWALGTSGVRTQVVTNSLSRWTGNAVELTLAEPSTVAVEAYDLKGTQKGKLSNVKLGAGSHSLPLVMAASGIVWLRVTVNGLSEVVLAGLGGGVRPIRESFVHMAARSQGIGDTLLFTWKDKVLVRVALANLDTTGIVVKIGTDSSIAWNESITYDNVYDARDGQVYRTVAISNQVWMAENLNYSGVSGSTGVCYNNSADSCKKYGRLYTWAEAMSGHASSTTRPSGVQGICPSGWHVPSDSEWMTMQSILGAPNYRDGIKLKSTSGWYDTGNGVDEYGFRALPGGGLDGGASYDAGFTGYWWSATENDAANAWSRVLCYYYTSLDRIDYYETYGYSLRCLGN